MKRGQIWWAHVDERCPVVLLGESGTDKMKAMVIVAPSDTNIEGHAVEVTVGHDEGLPHQGVLRVALPRQGRINCNWLVMVSRGALREQVGAVSSEKLLQIEEALRLGELG